jgi:hypothetical protein
MDVFVVVPHAMGVTQLVIGALFELGLFVLPGEAAGAQGSQLRELLLEGCNVFLNPI